MQDQNIFSVSEEFSKANFGDKRLTRRLVQIGDAVSKRPDDSFPDATGSVAELEGTYRFFGNSKVTPERILAPHVAGTVARCTGADRLVVAHDTTTLIFGGNSRIDEIGHLTQGKQGFLGHVALALNRGLLVRPLGILGLKTVFRHGEPKSKRGKKDPTCESLRWWELAKEVENKLPIGAKPIHVMDREADDFKLFSNLSAAQMRFVIRVRQDRVSCRKIGDLKKESLFEICTKAEVLAHRKIYLSPRLSENLIGSKKIHKPRGARESTIEIAAVTIKVPRPEHCPAVGADYLLLNYVHVYEVNTPQGEEPVNWKLVTTEPINSEEDVLQIVDDYRSRWMIEEFFKALKTGCGYEKRQLETKQTLLNALAILMPVAWQLLVLRSVSRQQAVAPATYALSKTQITILRAVTKKKPPENPTITEAMLAIASLGGHIPNNGNPGWIVLGRGMERFLTMEIAWNAAMAQKM